MPFTFESRFFFLWNIKLTHATSSHAINARTLEVISVLSGYITNKIVSCVASADCATEKQTKDASARWLPGVLITVKWHQRKNTSHYDFFLFRAFIIFFILYVNEILDKVGFLYGKKCSLILRVCRKLCRNNSSDYAHSKKRCS